MKSVFLFSRRVFPLVLLPCIACSGVLDLGSDDGKQAAPALPPAATQPDGGAATKPSPACGDIAPGVTEIFRAKGAEIFNVMDLASDGVHVYLAGSAPLDAPGGAVTPPDPSSPMKTASLIRVPVGGGALEVVDFEHGRVSRGVTFDADNIYWASEFNDAVLMRPKSGGTVTPLEMSAPSGIPQSVATDGSGNVFWATWTGEIAKRAPGGTIAQTFQTTSGTNDNATWVHADGTSVYWIAGRGELRVAPIAGGPATVLAPNVPYVYRLGTDADFVWGIANDELWKVPKKGGARVVVTTAKPGRDLRSFALTPDAVYFSDDMEPLPGGGKVVNGPIYRVNKDGSNLTAVTPDLDSARNVTTDGCRVYWNASEWVGNPGFETIVQAQRL